MVSRRQTGSSRACSRFLWPHSWRHSFCSSAFRAEQIIAQPLVIAMLALPILIQVYFNAGFAYLLNRLAGEQHCVAGPSALIGASNFFELAVAAAISLFGFNSGAALATVVGVLIEVPVMLSVVWIVNASRIGTSGPKLSYHKKTRAFSTVIKAEQRPQPASQHAPAGDTKSM